jgi:GNAT superfamily N-acetyltransferase
MKKKAEGVELEYRPVARLSGETLDDFKRVFETSFPAEEREPTDEVVGEINDGTLLCFGAMQGDNLRGLSVLRALTGGAAGIQFLVYLAVDADYRSGGGGGKLLQECIRQLKPALGVVLEVEDPDVKSAANAEDRLRRVAFYKKQGAIIVTEAPDYQAPDSGNKSHTLPFKLRWIPTSSMAELAGQRLKACVLALLTQGYGLSPDDKVVLRNLATLQASAKL